MAHNERRSDSFKDDFLYSFGFVIGNCHENQGSLRRPYALNLGFPIPTLHQQETSYQICQEQSPQTNRR